RAVEQLVTGEEDVGHAPARQAPVQLVPTVEHRLLGHGSFERTTPGARLPLPPPHEPALFATARRRSAAAVLDGEGLLDELLRDRRGDPTARTFARARLVFDQNGDHHLRRTSRGSGEAREPGLGQRARVVQLSGTGLAADLDAVDLRGRSG